MGGRGTSVQMKSITFWTFAGELSRKKVIQGSQQEIYNNFFNKFTTGAHSFSILEDPFVVEVMPTQPTLERPGIDFKDLDLNLMPVKKLGLQDLGFMDESAPILWNPFFKRPTGPYRIPLPSRDIEGLASNGLGEPELNSQQSPPADIGSLAELQPGDGGGGSDDLSPEASASRPSGVGGHEGIKALDGVSDGELAAGKLPSLPKGTCDVKQGIKRKSDVTEAQEDADLAILDPIAAKRAKFLPDNHQCTIIGDRCKSILGSRDALRGHYRTFHKQEYLQLQAEGVIGTQSTDDKKFFCPIEGCKSKGYRQKTNLTTHMNSKHGTYKESQAETDTPGGDNQAANHIFPQ